MSWLVSAAMVKIGCIFIYLSEVRNRWLVAYTLIKNPSLQKCTANNIALLAKEKDLQANEVFLFKDDIQDVMSDWKIMKSDKSKELAVDCKVDLGEEYAQTRQTAQDSQLYPR